MFEFEPNHEYTAKYNGEFVYARCRSRNRNRALFEIVDTDDLIMGDVEVVYCPIGSYYTEKLNSEVLSVYAAD